MQHSRFDNFRTKWNFFHIVFSTAIDLKALPKHLSFILIPLNNPLYSGFISHQKPPITGQVLYITFTRFTELNSDWNSQNDQLY
uniref:Uncharacterized protein n=2 Tax=Picea TaxID=3328 RepID=A0A101LXF0_PICGL|nr:hypothetical protein ABT39_MTgene6121 [Picea glauca]QHR92580.1 hypothetical protein Q903MT_gene6626 [Picea sitchensis]